MTSKGLAVFPIILMFMTSFILSVLQQIYIDHPLVLEIQNCNTIPAFWGFEEVGMAEYSKSICLGQGF
jgi:hypothetical protein